MCPKPKRKSRKKQITNGTHGSPARTYYSFAAIIFPDLLKPGFVFRIEAIQLRAIDIQHAEQMRIVAHQRHDDFRSRSGVARDVAGKLVHVRDPKDVFFSAAVPTDAASKCNPDAGRAGLGRARAPARLL